MNFKPTKAHTQMVQNEYCKNRCYVNSQGIVVSRERPQNEVSPDKYNLYWKENPHYDKEHPYIQTTVDLCRKWYNKPQNILEVGAGFGYPQEKQNVSKILPCISITLKAPACL